jgi:uncharacterized protein YjbJ (UPF0337 family)
MIQDKFRGKWPLLGARIRQKWSKLTADDIDRREGGRDYLVGKLQERYGIAKEKALVEVKEFERALR